MAKSTLIRHHVEVDDTFFLNTPRGQRHPRSEPWVYTVLLSEFETWKGPSGRIWKRKKRIARTLMGKTRRECDKALIALVEQPHTKVVPETTRK